MGWSCAVFAKDFIRRGKDDRWITFDSCGFAFIAEFGQSRCVSSHALYVLCRDFGMDTLYSN